MAKLVERKERLSVALLLCAYLVALGWQAWHVGLTFDEPTHMVGSYLYWLNRPDLYPQDLPPLLKILTGWIPRVLQIPLYPELPSWKEGWAQDVASDILDRLPAEEIQELFYLMRLVLTVFPVLTALLIWHWGRVLFGRTAGWLLLVAAILSPTALAHGCLLKSDVAAEFSYLLFVFCGWRFWLEPSRKNSLILGAAALLAVLAKMSLLVVVLLAPLLVVARIIRGPRPLRNWLGFALAAVLLIPYAGLIAAYKFDARRLTAQDLAEMEAGEEFPKPVIRVATVFRLIPTPTDVQRAVRSLSSYQRSGAPSFMLGQARSSGSPGYFPFALAIKTPIAIQILFMGGVLLVIRRIRARQAEAADWFLVVAGFLYVGLAAQSNLQLGVRLVLPSLPFILLVGGFAIEQALATRRGRVALAVVFTWLAATSAAIYPQGIAYFNAWVGGPDRGWKYLSDSNIDWGQNLPELAAYVRQNGVKALKLYYWGADKIQRYGVQDRVEMKPPPWGEFAAEPRLTPTPGLYAVSVTFLHGQFFDDQHRDYFQYFRDRQPDGKAGFSIFIYRVN